MTLNTPEDFMGLAISLAVNNVHLGGGPFGAVLVLENGTLITGVNSVTLRNDPTQHAEVAAIRNAGEALGRFSFEDATLYSSCAPCPMCLTAALWARIPRIVYAATPDDAAAAGFSDVEFYEALGTSFYDALVGEDSPAELVWDQTREDALAPFGAWERQTRRIDY